MNDRVNQILEILTKEKRVEVSKLAKSLCVSEVTIRKDLDILENKSIIKREYGYALLLSDDDINGRIAYHYDTKRMIAKEACKLVSDGDTIMIESGSCCALLAEELVNIKKNLTIITNSSFIASYIRNNTNVNIVLLGGIYQKDAQINVGPLVKQCAKDFLVDLVFIGTDGYDEVAGFTNRNQLRAEAVNDMALQTKKVVVLTESEKFKKRGTVPLKLNDKEVIVITDSNIDDETKINLASNNYKLIEVTKQV